MLDPYAEFSNNGQDVYARAKRDFSFYSPYVDFYGKRILDVGIGNGRKTAFISTKSGEVIGVEICKESIISANHFVRERELGNVDLVQADAACLPVRQKSFEIVISNDALEHFADWRTSVLEMQRVLKNEGHICLNFGPLWLSPFGSHMDFQEFFSPPWGHLFFSEDAIKDTMIYLRRIEAKDRNKPLFMNHLNRISVKEFKQIIMKAELKTIFIMLRSAPPFRHFLKTPFYEYFTNGVVAILKRTKSINDSSCDSI